MRYFYLIIILNCFIRTSAQLDFEKHKNIKYKEYKNWESIDEYDSLKKITYKITIKKFFEKKNSLKLELTCLDTIGNRTIKIYKNDKLIQNIVESEEDYNIIRPYSIFVADYNNDGLMDVKFLQPFHGCGAFNTYSRVRYLLQKRNNEFVKISFTDNFFESDINRLERDFDNDGKFEIITQTFQSHKNHNYWLYNVYEIKNYEIHNVNNKFDYPIMVQILYSGSTEITRKLTRKMMKKYSRKYPDELIKK